MKWLVCRCAHVVANVRRNERVSTKHPGFMAANRTAKDHTVDVGSYSRKGHAIQCRAWGKSINSRSVRLEVISATETPSNPTVASNLI